MSQRKKDVNPYEEKQKMYTYKSKTDPDKYFIKVYFSGVEQPPEPEETSMLNGVEYELTDDEIGLDWNSMPEHTKNDLADAALKAYIGFMKRPDAQEVLKRERELLRQEGSTLLEPRPVK